MDTSNIRKKRMDSRLTFEKARAEFEEAYSKITDPEIKATVDGLLRSSQNYTSADPMNNRSAREYATQLYINATKVAKGEYNEPLNPVASTKNIFNGYSHDENIANANTLTSKYLNQPTSQTSINSETDDTLYHEFDIKTGLDKVYGLSTDTFEQRYGRFIDHLLKKISDAISAKSSGTQIRGIDQKDVERLETISSELSNLKTYVTEGKDINGQKVKLSKNEALSELLNYAGILNIDEGTFTNYFRNFLPQESSTQGLGNSKYSFKDSTGSSILDSKGYKVGTKDNVDYLFDKDNNKITTPEIWVDDDITSPTVGQGYVIGSDGKFWFGDFSSLQEDNPYLQLIREYIENLKTGESGNSSRYHIYRDWNDLIFDSDNDFVKNLQSLYAQDLNGHNVVDVGSYFDGDTPVFAVYSGDPNEFIDDWGHLNLLAPGTTFYYIDPKTNSIIKGSYENVVSTLGKLNRKSKKNNPIQIKNYRDDLNILSREFYYPQESTNFDGSDWTTWKRDRVTDYNGIKIGVTESIKDHPIEWVKLILEIIGDPNQSSLSPEKLLMKERFYNNPKQLLGTIWSIMTDPQFKDKIQLTETQRRGWNILIERVVRETQQTQVQEEKNGGIIKAAEGVTTGLFGQTNSGSTTLRVRSSIDAQIKKEDELQERAAKRGVDVKTQLASEQLGLTAYDKARMGMIIGDIASLVAALSGAPTAGYGSIAADVLGIGTAIGDTVIDALDPSVSKWETIINAGLNTAFGLAGFAGGALGKLSKRLPSIIHLTAKAVAVGGGLKAITDPEIRSSIGKVINSGKAGSEPMTTKDWQNLMIFFRSTLGATKAVSTSVAGKRMTRGNKSKAKSLENSEQNLVLTNPDLKVIKIGNKSYNINTSQEAEINKAIKNGENEKVTQLLKNLGISDEDISKVSIKDGKLLGLIKPKIEVTVPGKKSVVQSLRSKFSNRFGNGDEDLSDEQIIELLKQADINAKNKLNNSWWLRRMYNWDRVALALTPWRGSKPYSAEQISLMREANKGVPRSENIVEGRKNKEFGTREFREKLLSRIDKESVSATSSLQNIPAPGTVESVKYKKERVEEIVKDIDRFSKNRPRRSQKTTSELYAKAKEYESEIRNLLADLDIQGEDRDLLYDTLNKLIDFRKAMKLRSPQLWSQHGFKQGGKIDSKYSHLRK